MRLVPFPSNFDGSGSYRVLFPVREMSYRGFEVAMLPRVEQPQPNGAPLIHYGLWERVPGAMRLVKAAHELLAENEFDVLVMNQRDEPGWAEVIGGLRGQGKRVVLDSDDDWLNLPVWNPGSRRSKQATRAMLDMLGAADVLTVSTPALAELYAPYRSDRPVVIRNRLDWWMWEDAPLAYEQERRRFRVGWMGDSRWRMGDLGVLRGVIGPWLERNPDAEFVAAGDPSIHHLLGVPRRQRVSVMASHFHNRDLADITAVMDVGLVPLVMGRFNEAKSHLKGLEYAACGIPCIATPTESYRWWVEPGVNGLLAGKPREWFQALDAMKENWRSMGAAAHAKASEHTIQGAGADEWEAVYRGVDREPAGTLAAAA